MTDLVKVKILHNITWQSKRTPFAPYVPRDRLLQVLSFECPLPACGHIKMLLRIIFDQLNNYGEPDGPPGQTLWAMRYRQAGHRSLSVGDVVVIGESAWAVDLVGWLPVTVQSEQIWFDVGKLADDGIRMKYNT